VVLSWTTLNTVAFAIFTVAPGSNCAPVIVPHVPAVVTTFGEMAAIVGWMPVGVDGEGDPDGAGSDDGTDGEGGDPPQAAAVNAIISSISILASFKFVARVLNQHNYVKLRGEVITLVYMV
jgi:hypothetical protein